MPGCQQDNPPHARFCLGCGARLALTCGSCGAELPGGARFCLQCGKAATAGTAAPVGAPAPETYTPKLLRPEYGIHRVTKVRAQTLEELAAKLEDVNAEGFLRTVRAFNAAVRSDVPFDPYTRDGRGTVGLEPEKSNWANPIDQPPFEAYATTCGITFTFGGLRVDSDAQVLDHDAAKIAGLYAAGEMVGGIFYFNYPSGAGLVSGAVFGRLAGASAARSPGRI